MQEDDCTPSGEMIESSVREVQVVPGVWISGISALKDQEFMQNIGAVVTAFPLNHHDISERELDCLLRGKQRFRVPVEDSPSVLIRPYFEPVARWIDEQRKANKNVLIHCFKGHGRSITLAVYYMVSRYRWRFPTVAAALAEIRLHRPCIHPNEGFMKQLEESLEIGDV